MTSAAEVIVRVDQSRLTLWLTDQMLCPASGLRRVRQSFDGSAIGGKVALGPAHDGQKLVASTFVYTHSRTITPIPDVAFQAGLSSLVQHARTRWPTGLPARSPAGSNTVVQCFLAYDVPRWPVLLGSDLELNPA